MKGNPSRPALEGIDKKNSRPSIHVPHAQAKRFSKTNSSAVKDQNQGPVERSSKARTLEISAERQQIQNVLLGKKIRNERGLGRQVRPDRFNDASWIGKSAQITVELPEDRCVIGHADCFTSRFARQPCDHRLVKPPVVISGRILDKKSIELTQRKFRTRVSIAKAPLELKEAK